MATTSPTADEVVVEHRVVESQPLRTRIGVGLFLVLLGVVSLWFLGLRLDPGVKTSTSEQNS